MVALSDQQGLSLLDWALAGNSAELAVAIGLDPAAVWVAADGRAPAVPPLLRDLVRVRRRAAIASTSYPQPDLARRLVGLDPAEQRKVVLNFVRDQVAVVLGHSKGSRIPAGRKFQELGFDSLMGVELRNRLRTATGLRLPATMVFDHPTCEQLAGYVHQQAAPSQALPCRQDEEAAIRSVLQRLSLADLKNLGVLEALQSLTGGPKRPEVETVPSTSIDDMGLTELVQAALEMRNGR
jgi:acyl carrier protein